MKKLVFLGITCLSFVSQATTIKVACGDQAYDSLNDDNTELADVLLEVELKGPNNPPASWTLYKGGATVASGANGGRIDYKSGDDGKNFTVRVHYDTYEFTGVKNCEDIDEATGALNWKKYVGGFAGTNSNRLTCSCLQVKAVAKPAPAPVEEEKPAAKPKAKPTAGGKKKLTCPKVKHINCMPPTSNPYCASETRRWVQQNCPGVSYLD